MKANAGLVVNEPTELIEAIDPEPDALVVVNASAVRAPVDACVVCPL